MEAYEVTYRDGTTRVTRCLDDATAIHLAESINASVEGDRFNGLVSPFGAFDVVAVRHIDVITDTPESEPIYTHE